MAASGVGQLVLFIDGILKKDGFLKILKENVRQSAEKFGIRATFKFYQDNDSKHSSRLCQEWALYNIPKMLHPSPQSPDLNVIENLWDVHQRPISSVQELRLRLQEERAKISPKYTRHPVLISINVVVCGE